MNEQSWLSPKIEIRGSSLGGKGMFAVSHIPLGEKVLEWRGNYVRKPEADEATSAGKLVMQWDEDLYSIEDRGDDQGYFLNHSCDPNIWMIDAHTFTAMKDIEPGQEITVDYALWSTGDYVSKWECKCGSLLCRHKITGEDWKLPELQEKYKGHFSPLVNKKIAAEKSSMKNNDYHNLVLQSLPESYKEWFEEEKRYLKEHITENSYVLEVGSGDGRSVNDLLLVTKNIIGIDHDENAIKEAESRFKEFETIKFLQVEADKLPFEDQSFDFVICITSFANFGEKKYVILEEMKRVLKDQGKIIISVFSQNALDERLSVYKKLMVPIKEIRENGTVIFDEKIGDNISEQFTKADLEGIFGKSNLQIEDITEVNIAYLCTLTK